MILPAALTIAGSDPSGGAGIQADLKTFHRFGVYGQAVITLLTVQNTVSVSRVEITDPDLVEQQIRAVIEDIPPAAAKTGALGSIAIIETVARIAAEFRFPLIVDPVMISKHGAPLLDERARDAFRELLLPRCDLVTPNLHEAGVLTGGPVTDPAGMRIACERLAAAGARAVLVKGGHLEGAAVDVFFDGRNFFEFQAARIETRHTHGSGCAYSAAIAAHLARGEPMLDSIRLSKQFITDAIRSAPGLGRGNGPLNHFA